VLRFKAGISHYFWEASMNDGFSQATPFHEDSLSNSSPRKTMANHSRKPLKKLSSAHSKSIKKHRTSADRKRLPIDKCSIKKPEIDNDKKVVT
jgi:hypothetical protein